MAAINCPLCKKECSTVSRNYVYSQVKKHFRPHLKSEGYGSCKDPLCDIVYFGLSNEEIYFKRDFDEEMK